MEVKKIAKRNVPFPNRHALRGELTWTHYRALLKVENKAARNWYMEECVNHDQR